MDIEHHPISKSNLFALGILMLSGSMNSYANCIYGVVAGAHTGDLTKMSAHIANGKWDSALNNALMILFCIIGVFLTEFLKHNYKRKGDWRKLALLLLAAGLLGMGFVSIDAPKQLMCYICSFFCGFMLNLFRECNAGSFNSTIQTGNIRTLSQYLYEAIDPNCKGNWKRFLNFLYLILAYAIGACLITIACNKFHQKAIIFSAATCFSMFLWLRKSEK